MHLRFLAVHSNHHHTAANMKLLILFLFLGVLKITATPLSININIEAGLASVTDFASPPSNEPTEDTNSPTHFSFHHSASELAQHPITILEVTGVPATVVCSKGKWEWSYL